MDWRAHLQARLREIQPPSVCALDETARALARSTLQTASICIVDSMPASPCALALGIDVLNGLDAQQAQQLIGRIRLYAASHLLLAVPSDCALDEDAFRALGFVLAARDESASRRLHEYDLDTYKTVPDWLNARFWAHPERWEP